MTKHKHAELIKLWADGAKIQYKDVNGIECWCDTPHPSWDSETTYRIKPEKKKPVVRWLWADRQGYISATLCTEKEAYQPYKIKLEWSRTEFPE